MSRGLRRLRFQNRILGLVVIGAVPALLASSVALMRWDASPALRWLLFALVTGSVVCGAVVVRQRVMHPLQSLANLLEALREGDYSLRGRASDPSDAVGEVMVELNMLSQALYDSRLEGLEAGVLLGKVISEIDIAVFAFDAGRRLRLVNPAGEALLDREHGELQGASAAELGIETLLDEPSGTILAHVFPGGAGRWEIRRRAFREGGKPHELLVISDLSRALREEERQAWRRMVRVIGHELNSSLAPIHSMAGTLARLIDRDPLPEDWRDDAHAGLRIIEARAEALKRFMGAYARLARLPPPARRRVDFGSVAGGVASLYGERVSVEPGPPLELEVDPDQIEQVLINLVKNAVEAAGDSGVVCVRWHVGASGIEVEVEDEGPGLANTDNLWVPFFTTKSGGSGIGLVLSREIVENHGGRISLENRAEGSGCVARFTLPGGAVRAAAG